MIRAGRNNKINESINPLADQFKTADWVVIDTNPTKDGMASLIPMKVEAVGLDSFSGLVNAEKFEYSKSSVRAVCRNEEEAIDFIETYKNRTSGDIYDLVTMTESTFNGDRLRSYNQVKIGDTVSWTLEGMGRLPKIGSEFRVGPMIGICTKVSDNKAWMKVTSNSFADLSESKK